jgi:DNA-binding transcriptional regulator GbsR (MarR family)
MEDISGDELDSQTVTFIENIGSLISDQGLPRSVGRVLGLLLICKPDHQSAEDIQNKLKLSSGAVSLATNMLKNIGLAKIVTFPGDRKYYYQLDHECWRQLVQARLEQLKRGITIAEQGLSILKDDPRLLGLRDTYVTFEKALRSAAQNVIESSTD